MYKNIAVIGSSGAIGSAFIDNLSNLYPDSQIYAFSRTIKENFANISYYKINYLNEESIQNSAEISSKNNKLDLIIVANGILHGDDFQPEKSLKDISLNNLQKIFQANTVTPALIAKYFLPYIAKEERSVFACLSAKVGSISDNKLGGWYAYRASKSALNMVIKNASIEVGRRFKKSIIVGLHPGTVDSNLSKPFQGNVAKDKLFTPDYSAKKLIGVINDLEVKDTGKCFAWDGKEIYL